MSSNKQTKKKKKITVQSQREQQIDTAILKLRDDLEETGIYDDELILAMCKIYAKSILIAYKKSLED